MQTARAAGIIGRALLARRPRKSEYVNKFNKYDYALTRPTVTTTTLTVQFPFKDISAEPLPPGVKELAGYQATGKLPIVRRVKNRNSLLGANKVGAVKRWAFQIDFKAPNSTAYVTHFDKGQVQITCTGPHEQVLRFLHKHVYPGIWNQPVTINKIDTKMNVNRAIKLDGLLSEIVNKIPSAKCLATYEPEIFSGLQLKWKESPVLSMKIFTNGSMLTIGLKKFEDVGLSARVFESFFKKYGVDPQAVFKYAKGGGYEGIAKPAVPLRKNLGAKKARMLNARYNLARGYNNTRNGFYVRPGPNGQPRFYPMVANLRLIKTKTLRAYANAGVPVPASVRNLLGLAEGATPAAKTEGRRAPSFNSVKNGYYVKPGVGGAPYFYKMPKGIKEARKTVVAAYQKAGVRIPATVKALFEMEASPEAMHLKKTHYVNTNAKGTLRINGKQYDRYTREELLRVARNLDIAAVSNKSKLENIAKEIKKTVKNFFNKPDLVVNGQPVVFLPNGRVKRGNRPRQWATIGPAEQNALAKAYLPNANYATWLGLIPSDKYTALLAHKGERKVEAVNSARSNSVSSSVSTPGENFELTLLAQGVLGSNASNNDVNSLEKILQSLPKGAKGRALKPDVDRAIKNFKNHILRRNQLANVKAKYLAGIKIPNWLPANKAQSYKNYLVSVATKPNNKGKFPAKKDIAKQAKTWLRLHVNQTARAAYNAENMNTGKIVRVPAYNPPTILTPNVNSPALKRLGAPRAPRKAPLKPRNKTDPRENKAYALPRNSEAVENLATAMTNLGLGIGATNKYSWKFLKNKGINNKFKNVWLRNVASPINFNSLKTTKARANYIAARKNTLNKNALKALRARKAAANKANQNRRAAKKTGN
jgi:TATA-box binding protein (TBP) (component of TFIID and TFIIIB)